MPKPQGSSSVQPPSLSQATLVTVKHDAEGIVDGVLHEVLVSPYKFSGLLIGLWWWELIVVVAHGSSAFKLVLEL